MQKWSFLRQFIFPWDMKQIYADFMKMDDEGHLILTCFGTHKDLEKHKISLTDGLKLVFYNDDADNNGNPV